VRLFLIFQQVIETARRVLQLILMSGSLVWRNLIWKMLSHRIGRRFAASGGRRIQAGKGRTTDDRPGNWLGRLSRRRPQRWRSLVSSRLCGCRLGLRQNCLLTLSDGRLTRFRGVWSRCREGLRRLNRSLGFLNQSRSAHSAKIIALGILTAAYSAAHAASRSNRGNLGIQHL